MVGRVRKRLFSILFQEHSEYSEFQCASILLSWGLWMIRDPFVQMNEGNPYRVMASYAPHDFWYTCFILLGLTHMLSLIFVWNLTRFIMTMIEFAWWFLVFLMFASSNASLPVVPTSFTLSIWSGWNHVRLSMHRSP